MTADPRVTAARAFLAGARKRKFDGKPNSVLVREAAELRHQLGQVLNVISEGMMISPADVQTVLCALAIAARWDDLTAGAGEDHLAGTGQAAAYRQLASRLGGDR